jgi:Hint domain
MAGPYNGPLPGTIASGSTYSTVKIDNTSFSGRLTNAGTISGATTGISVVDSTITGAIIDSGIIAGTAIGISVDNQSKITGTRAAIFVSGPTFIGGIVNAGTLRATSYPAAPILVGGNVNGTSDTVSTFTGGITNTGSILAPDTHPGSPTNGILVGGAASHGGSVTIDTFSGGISNSGGTVKAGNGIGVGGYAFSGGSITISSFSDGIENSGLIAPGGTSPTAAGIFIGGGAFGGSVEIVSFGGGIDNNGGTISAGAGILVGGTASRGGTVTVEDFSGGVANSGHITAINVGIGISGRLFNTPGATKPLVTISDFSGGITNSGTISAVNVGIGIGGSSPLAVTISDFSGGITNTGTISAAIGIAISHDQTFSGAIIDTGVIDGVNVGIFVDILTANTAAKTAISVTGPTFTGGINNAGVLAASDIGIFVGGTTAGGGGGAANVSTFTGGIANSGTISGSVSGINVYTVESFLGDISNSGTISAGHDSGIYVDNVATFTGNIVNKTGASISADDSGIVVSNDTLFDGGITNAGAIIAGDGEKGIAVYQTPDFTGSIVNTSRGTINGAATSALPASGISAEAGSLFGGGISNSGTITVESRGINVEDYSTFQGSIVNESGGTISAGFAGIDVNDDETFGGGITNSSNATITTRDVGIIVSSVGQFGTANPGGGIVNAGTISVSGLSGQGIFVGADAFFGNSASLSLFDGGITNSGAISATGDGGVGIFVGGHAIYGALATISTFSGGITNSAGGTITAGGVGIVVGGDAAYYDASVVVAAFTGGIVNSSGATISAGFDGILVGGTAVATRLAGSSVTVSDFSGGITNNGTITATSGAGVEVGGHIIITSPSSIRSEASVTISTFGGDIVNTGTISGASAIVVDDVATFSNDIVNSHSGLIVATSGAGIQVGEISLNPFGGPFSGLFRSSVNLLPVASFLGGITNSGTISFSEQVAFQPGGFLRGGIIVGGSFTTNTFLVSTFAGGITNTGTIAGVAGTGPNFGVDISVANVSAFSGGITNSGSLSASPTAFSVGIGLLDDQTVTGDIVNQTTGTINVGGVGIDLEDIGTFAGNIINRGAISANTGIEVTGVAAFGASTAAGNITNVGAITAIFTGISIEESTIRGSIVDTGIIEAGTHGIFINSASAIISSATAISIRGPTFTGGIENDGTISAANGVGIDVTNVSTFDGGITNTGTISAAVGIELAGTPGTSVFDSGVIVGTGGTAIQLDPASGTDTLTLAAGYAITGNVIGGGSDTLQLGGSGTANFDFNAIGTQYTGFTTFDVIGGTWSTTGSGLDWNVEGGTLQVGGTVTDTTVDSGGTLDILAGGTADPTTVEPGGSETVSAGGSDTGANVYGTQYVYGSASDSTVFAGGRVVVENGGTISGAVISGGTVEVVSGGNVGSSISFATNSGTLQIDGPNTPGLLLAGTTISGFVPGDMIDLTGVDYSAPNSVFVNGSDQLQFTEGGNTYEIQLFGDFTGDTFHLAADNGGPGPGTEITETPCYCPGTLIRTPRGQKKIEKLKIGDKVMTAAGAARPIKWIGRRSYGGRFVMGRKDILPVCIKAGALGDNVPRRDLWISPNHALYLDGMLIEAKDLINGVSVVQTDSAERVEYIHVELETHDVIIAEGALAESYIDDDNRLLFQNAHEYREKYAEVASGRAQYCAPRRDDGYEVEAVRQRIALRAELPAANPDTAAGALRGYVDRVTAACVAGWAQNLDHPEAPVCLDIYAGGQLIGQVLANSYREDLQKAGMGSGRHSFEFTLPPELVVAPDEIEVRRSLDSVALGFTGDAWRMMRQSARRVSGWQYAA